MLFGACGDVRAQVMRGPALADAGNVVFLSLDRQQRDATDLCRVHGHASMHHLTAGKLVLHKSCIDGLQEKLGGQIHDGEVLVIERAVLFSGISIAMH